MNDANHSELLALLSELSRHYPDWRFGQLVANICGWADKEIWDVEDEELRAAAKVHLDEIHQRLNELGV